MGEIRNHRPFSCDPNGAAVYVIAEIGSNHASCLETALESIDAAAATGADAVKFQSISLEALYHEPGDETRDLHRKIDLPESWYPALKARCGEKGVDFLSSPTYLRAIDLLEEQGVSAYKLASAQVAVFPQLVRKVASLGKPVFLSTGLVTMEELDRVVAIFREVGNERFVILHCNSVYPAPPEIVHLPRMGDYRDRYGCAVGFSDHTENDVAAVAAVAMGASVIERHFTLRHDLDSPDAPFALEPDRFGEFVRAVREAEAVCDPSPRIALEAPESTFRSVIHHCPVALRDIAEGEELTGENVRLMRGNASPLIDAWDWDAGGSGKRRLASRSIPCGAWISPQDFRIL